MFFDYIFTFMQNLEEKILEFEFQSKEKEKYKLDQDKLAFKETYQKLKELRDVLRKVSSLRNGVSGDVFFKSLAKQFCAKSQ